MECSAIKELWAHETDFPIFSIRFSSERTEEVVLRHPEEMELSEDRWYNLEQLDKLQKAYCKKYSPNYLLENDIQQIKKALTDIRRRLKNHQRHKIAKELVANDLHLLSLIKITDLL